MEGAMSNDRRFGYGYPSYIENAFQASCYDGIERARQQAAKTAAENAAFGKRMAEKAAYEKEMAAYAAAGQPAFYDPFPGSFPGAGGSGAWADIQNSQPSLSHRSYTDSARRTGHGTLLLLGMGIFAALAMLLYLA